MNAAQNYVGKGSHATTTEGVAKNTPSAATTPDSSPPAALLRADAVFSVNLSILHGSQSDAADAFDALTCQQEQYLQCLMESLGEENGNSAYFWHESYQNLTETVKDFVHSLIKLAYRNYLASEPNYHQACQRIRDESRAAFIGKYFEPKGQAKTPSPIPEPEYLRGLSAVERDIMASFVDKGLSGDHLATIAEQLMHPERFKTVRVE